ncbi:hypothetical protein [Natronobeatus ordinarius]|uniref:hypothetical protein n=1 Tax=Natronobeatus ordinarius TaxID=2963433 RepID=UPI0020CF53B6|nr:hypothetical protein [Natronobeatus ordinarius]
MSGVLELAVLSVLLVLVAGVAAVINAVRPFIANAVVGLLVFVLADVLFGLEVALTVLAVAIVVLGGAPGAALVLLLSAFGLAFVP